MRSRTMLLGATALFGLATAASASPLVMAAVDDSVTVTVAGEKSPLLAKAKDAGVLADTQALPHVTLVLKRPATQQAALDKLVHDQQLRTSPSYHKWLAASDLRSYGPDQADIDKVVAWLQSRGLTVNSVSPSGMSIDFAGAPSAVGSAFHTSLHSVTMPNGEAHIANVTDIAIPAALSPVVRGATLSNFFPKPNMVKALTAVAGKKGGVSPNLDSVDGLEAVSPLDFNVIYNVNPLLTGSASTGKATGAGIVVATLERTDILKADWKSFRKAFGLSGYAGTLEVHHPACSDPGTNGDEGEAALDAEWISVADPDATVYAASCLDGPLTFGVETALQGMVENTSQPSVFSISYGGPEQENSATFLAGWVNLLEEAASEGKSVFISAGDSGASYNRNAIAQDGLFANGLSTNPYNTTLGGTDFLDTSRGTNAKYWGAKNRKYFLSARGYIPETPWDNSCAGAVIAKFGGYSGAIASCNDANNPYNFQNGVGGSGGESQLYPKPDWQNIGLPGMPADGARDQPDVSLFSSNGFWNHFLVLCMSDANEGGTACDYKNVNDLFGNAAGGTSFAAPAFAGIAALVVQAVGPQGVMAPSLYALAKSQFTDSGLKTECESGHGRTPSNACVFYNVTVGDIAEPCYATTGDCFSTNKAVEGIGVLRNSDAPTVDAYQATKGYSLATGLGTVNVTNLVGAYVNTVPAITK